MCFRCKKNAIFLMTRWLCSCFLVIFVWYHCNFTYIVVTSSYSAQNKMFTTNKKAQCRETQPWYDSGVLEKWSTGHCLKVHRHGRDRDGTQGGPGDLKAIHSSPTVHY